MWDTVCILGAGERKNISLSRSLLAQTEKSFNFTLNLSVLKVFLHSLIENHWYMQAG